VSSQDVIIVGGGIIGGSIAFELARRGVRATILDRREPGREASWAAAGMLSPSPESPASIALVPLARASLALFPQFVSLIEEVSGRKAGYRAEGALEVFLRGDAERELSTLIAMNRGLGIECEPLRLEEAREMEPAMSEEARAAALFPNEAAVDNRALTAAVLTAAAVEGAEIRGGAAVKSLLREKDRCIGVETQSGEKLFAGQVVLAAGCWSSLLDGAASLGAPTRPVRGQMVALHHEGKPIRRVMRSERVYIVPRNDTRPQKLVLGSTLEDAGYEKRVTPGGLEKILSAVNELSPGLAHAEIIETWSGLRPGSPDQLPILGPASIEGLVMATGHYRNGILLSPITSKLVADWITEKTIPAEWEKFSPQRFARD